MSDSASREAKPKAFWFMHCLVSKSRRASLGRFFRSGPFFVQSLLAALMCDLCYICWKLRNHQLDELTECHSVSFCYTNTRRCICIYSYIQTHIERYTAETHMQVITHVYKHLVLSSLCLKDAETHV